MVPSLRAVLRLPAGVPQRRKVKVLVTSDHGSIHCAARQPRYSPSGTRPQNLRYKFGEDLPRAENPEHGLLMFTNEDLRLKLPRRGLGANTLLATATDSFFVYPTKLREYQSRYRGSFLHGGVTPEECILPVSLLTPRA